VLDHLMSEIFSSAWIVLLFCGAVLIGMTELGYLFGLKLHQAKDAARKEQISSIHGAVLGMLGLLLGFTFAMALDRYDKRRGLVIQEANAIGTTFLRASLLPDEQQEPVKALLRRYVDVRLDYQSQADSPAKHAEGMRLSSEIESELWSHAIRASQAAPNDITATFIESLNETIDTDAERIAAGRSRIPAGVSIILLVVASFGSFTSGYASGAHGARTLLNSLLMPLLITSVIVLIFDLTHPRQGFIGVSQQPLIDLRETMNLPNP
jgi:hypothetical protein